MFIFQGEKARTRVGAGEGRGGRGAEDLKQDPTDITEPNAGLEPRSGKTVTLAEVAHLTAELPRRRQQL